MKKFRFSLDKLRQLREARLESERTLLNSLLAERRAVERRRTELDEEEMRAMGELRLKRVVEVQELSALESFRRFAGVERGRLQSAAATLDGRIEQQREALLEVRRQVEALNSLRERRLEAWRKEMDRETENAIAELVVARWQDGRGLA